MNASKGESPVVENSADASLATTLRGSTLPAIEFASTAGEPISLQEVARSRAILYLYPRTSSPTEPSPANWDLIPGAKGCTAESCAFRDFKSELNAAGYTIFGLSAQTARYQREASERLHLNFPLLADPELRLAHALGLPTFAVGHLMLYRRITLLVGEGRIEKVFYPIAEPENHPAEVSQWVAKTQGSSMSSDFNGR